MKKTLLLLFLLFFTAVFSQDYILGKVVSEQNTDLPNVLVYNIRTNEKTFTDNEGNYMIAAKNNDELRFIKQKFDRISFRITPEDFKKNLKIKLIKSAVEIEEVKLKPTLTGNLKEDITRVAIVKTKLNKEISKYITKKSDPKILKPKHDEFIQPVGKGFSIGKINNQADNIDLADDILEILGEDYFIGLGLQKSEISAFIYHVMSGLDLKNALKYGYLKSSDILKFQQLAELKIKDFKKLK